MQIIINVLAGIGGLTVLSILWVVVVIAIDAHKEKRQEKKEEKQPICALTDKKCIFTSERFDYIGCNGCPIAEEAEENGNR